MDGISFLNDIPLLHQLNNTNDRILVFCLLILSFTFGFAIMVGVILAITVVCCITLFKDVSTLTKIAYTSVSAQFGTNGIAPNLPTLTYEDMLVSQKCRWLADVQDDHIDTPCNMSFIFYICMQCV